MHTETRISTAFSMERGTGIEPASPAWKDDAPSQTPDVARDSAQPANDLQTVEDFTLQEVDAVREAASAFQWWASTNTAASAEDRTWYARMSEALWPIVVKLQRLAGAVK